MEKSKQTCQLEITILKMKPEKNITDPAFVAILRTIRTQLGTHSRFFVPIEDPTLLYIFGFWSSVDAHHSFLNSPRKDEVLGPQEEWSDFLWQTHVEVLDMTAVPFEAPLLSWVQALVALEDKQIFEKYFTGCALKLMEDTKPYPLITAALDLPLNGGTEYLFITGWESEEKREAYEEEVKSDTHVAELVNVRNTKLIIRTLKDLEIVVKSEAS